MARKIAWQSHCYRFPKTGFSVAILVEYEGSDIPFYPVPFSKFHKTSDGIAEYIKDAQEAVTILSKTGDMEAKNIALVAKLELARFLPLKKEYWQKPSISYAVEDRIEVFMKCWNNPRNYLVLVVPGGKEKNKIQFNVVSAFRKKYLMKELIPFMRMSNIPVDPEATHVALYTPVEVRGLDSATGKWTKSTKPLAS